MKMTLKYFDTLKKSDFDNGAVLDEIRETIKAYEKLTSDNSDYTASPWSRWKNYCNEFIKK